MRIIHPHLPALLAAAACLAEAGRTKKKELPPLERYIQESAMPAGGTAASAGSLYQPGARFSDLARDMRASQVNDVVTILVYDRASAVASGTTNSKRNSSAKAGINSLFGPRPSPGPLTDLANLTGETQLQGNGETTRQTTLTTSLTARVTHVMPNGNLVLEGVKQITINSERQTIVVRGVARPNDLTPANQIQSDRLAMLEVTVTGKGVVGDAVRRPFILYRLLLGLLPF